MNTVTLHMPELRGNGDALIPLGFIKFKTGYGEIMNNNNNNNNNNKSMSCYSVQVSVYFFPKILNK